MDIDGNLRLCILNSETGLWSVSWKAIEKLYDALGICGENGICVNDPELKMFMPWIWRKSCEPVFYRCHLPTMFKFVKLSHVEFYRYDLNTSRYDNSRTSSNLLIWSPSMYRTVESDVKRVYLYGFEVAIGGIELLLFAFVFLLFGIYRIPASDDAEYNAILSQFRRSSYAEIKKAAKDFNHELGRGSAGIVYKGIRADERVVAVKRLQGSSFRCEDVLVAEVTPVGKINHMKLVTKWGFCSKHAQKLLFYEFMENQRHDKHLFSPEVLHDAEK